MSYWFELERECKELKAEVARLTEENDLQRQSIQNLSAQVVALREGLEVVKKISDEANSYDDIACSLQDIWETTNELLSSPDPGEKIMAVVEAAKKIRCGQQGVYKTCKYLHCQWHDSADCGCEKLFQALSNLGGGTQS